MMTKTNCFFFLVYLIHFFSWRNVLGNYAVELLNELTNGQNFNYTQNWYPLSPLCSSSAQSPIDIETRQAEKGTFPKFSRRKYIEKPNSISVSKGTRNFIVLPEYDKLYPLLTGGPLQGSYRLDYIAFHWGKHNKVGSEHTINGLKYPLEMQAVHYNDKYDSLFDAMDDPNGIAIVSYLFTVNEKNGGDLAIDLIQKKFNMLANKRIAEIELEYPFPISVLLPPVYKHYVTYKGSLTLPPCTENITWIVSYKPRPITSLQMDKFRMLYNCTPTLINNYRPIQLNNDRDLYIVK